jgi:hypothetical protein
MSANGTKIETAWLPKFADQPAAQSLAQHLACPPAIAQILVSRGIDTAAAGENRTTAALGLAALAISVHPGLRAWAEMTPPSAEASETGSPLPAHGRHRPRVQETQQFCYR